MSLQEIVSGRGTVLVRTMRAEDAAAVAAAFAAQGWYKPVEQYTRYLAESAQGQRVVLLAEHVGEFAGYVTIVWESDYPPFRDAAIPEIVDFNVLIKYQRRGIGTALLDEAERRIAVCSPVAGIGVGLTADYGAAQVLYVKRGYIPDGRGAVQYGQAVRHGERITVDDALAIYFTKRL
jgi:ribosomal protein S18 acetylase RimI-like enzyme